MADVTNVTKRMNYFDRQFLRRKDFQDEQDYHIDRRRRHNRLLHTPGVAEDLMVTGEVGSTMVTVSTGMAIDPEGREIVLAKERQLIMPIGPHSIYVYISYIEAPSDPSTDPGVTGYTRVEESPDLNWQAVVGAEQSGTVPDNVELLAWIQLDGNGHVVNIADVSTVAGAMISDGAITEPKLANNAVSTRTIQGNAVTETKLQSDPYDNNNRAVTTNHIKDGAITKEKISDNSVPISKMSVGSVLEGEVSIGAKQTAYLPLDDKAQHKFYLVSMYNTSEGLFSWQWIYAQAGEGPPSRWLAVTNLSEVTASIKGKIYELLEI